MTMQERKPVVEHQDAPPDDTPEEQPPAYTGDTGELAAIYESSGFNAVKELMEFDGPFQNVMSRGILSPKRANLMRRMLMKEMVEQDGSLNRIELMRAEVFISAAVDGEGRNQIVKILAGGFGAMKGAASNGIERMREWGRKF